MNELNYASLEASKKLVEALEKLQKDLPPEEVAFIYHNQIHRAQLKKIGDLDVASAVIDGRLIHLTVGDWRQFHYEPPLLKAAVNPGS